ncbi:uncharacterized protein [Heliangelus exortis]|uniref:uncharacterized protein n=1 Tax=Heliangelus exortis TaxID=472823 RepID=UPI003A8F4121
MSVLGPLPPGGRYQDPQGGRGPRRAALPCGSFVSLDRWLATHRGDAAPQRPPVGTGSGRDQKDARRGAGQAGRAASPGRPLGRRRSVGAGAPRKLLHSPRSAGARGTAQGSSASSRGGAVVRLSVCGGPPRPCPGDTGISLGSPGDPAMSRLSGAPAASGAARHRERRKTLHSLPLLRCGVLLIGESFRNPSNMNPFHQVQSLRNRLLQPGLHTESCPQRLHAVTGLLQEQSLPLPWGPPQLQIHISPSP